MTYLLVSLLNFSGSYVIEYGVAGSHTNFIILYKFYFLDIDALEEQHKLNNKSLLFLVTS